MLLDYKLKTPKERMQYVEKLLEETPKEQQTRRFCETLSDYVLNAVPKDKTILTENRLVTINKRETSFEGLSEKFESNEDAVYDLITDNPNQYLVPKISITQEDLDEVPELADCRSTIEHYKELYEKASGRNKYLLKKSIIDFCRDQYVIKQNRKPPVFPNKQRTPHNFEDPAIQDSFSIDPSTQEVISTGAFSLGNPAHISVLLTNYSYFKEDSYDRINSDMHYLLQDLEECADAALENSNPIYYEIMILKIDGLTNKEIQAELLEKFGKTYTPEYISCIWRQKIPKLIAEEAKRRYLDYHFTEEECGKWKKCSRCGQIKLMHPLYFSKNCTSKDGFYSMCKECRKKRQSKKTQEGDEKINGGNG